MIPIYEQDHGKGIGHSFDAFNRRFDAICREHLAAGRARAFAFIFYDFTDTELRSILRDQGAFAQLDRLAGTRLSLFYLHTKTRAVVERFNQQFLALLGVTDQAKLPCVVFFKVKNDQIEDIEIAQLDSADLIHGFHELYSVVECYLAAEQPAQAHESFALKWLKVCSKISGYRIGLGNSVSRT